MVDLIAVERAVSDAAGTLLPRSTFVRALTEAGTDSFGNDILNVTIVLNPKTWRSVSGDAVVDTIAGIQDHLQNVGEERFAVVEFVPEDELADHGDTES